MSFLGYHLALNLKRYMLRKLHPAFPSERRPPRADALPQRLGRLGSAIVSLKLPPLFPLSFSCQATPTANRELAMARKQRPRQNRAEATKRWTPSRSRMGDWPNQYTQGGGHQGRTPSRSGMEDWEVGSLDTAMSPDLLKQGRVSFAAVMQGVTRRSTSYSKVPVWLPFPFDVTAERGVCAQLPEIGRASCRERV